MEINNNAYSPPFPDNKIQKDTFLNSNSPSVDLVSHIDNVINKYKTQLESLKPKKVPSQNKWLDNYFNNKTNNTIDFSQFENTNNLNNNNNFNTNYEDNNFKLNNINNNNNLPLNNNTNIINNQNDSINNELANDNIKLQSLLTLEKSKVTQLTNLLKEKDNEINQLNQKINAIESEYNCVVNNLKDKYESNAAQQNESKINIIKEFFEFFNQNIPLLNKTNILKMDNDSKINFIENNDNKNSNEKSAMLAIESFDKLIKKLLSDNKELYNELVNFTSLFDKSKNKHLNLSKNLEILKEENKNLKNEINELLKENNYLRENDYINQNEIARIENNKRTNELMSNKSCKNLGDGKINSQFYPVSSNCDEVHYDDYPINNEYDSAGNNRMVSPIQQLRNKINNIENIFQNQN